MKFPEFLGSFEGLLDASPRERLDESSRIVVVSDLHLGNGGTRDDLAHNRGLVQESLETFYLRRGWTLVLNGDIEDLSKFGYERIRPAWAELFALFEDFHEQGRLRKILGNHDAGLELRRDYP